MPKVTGTEALIQASAKISDLTDRQVDVLSCLSTGLTNRQIAAHLGISEFTVKVHVGNALEALGLESRLQLGIAAYIHLTGCSCWSSARISGTADRHPGCARLHPGASHRRGSPAPSGET